MTFWDGNRWLPDEPPPPRTAAPSRVAAIVAALIMVLGAVATLAPLQQLAASSPKYRPALSLACDPAACSIGGSLTVTGRNFVPSSGGQQVFLWVGYPHDYCDAQVCHGFYFNPWVNDDGTFDATFPSALMGGGTGNVAAFQYAVKRDKWVEVDRVTYVVDHT